MGTCLTKLEISRKGSSMTHLREFQAQPLSNPVPMGVVAHRPNHHDPGFGVYYECCVCHRQEMPRALAGQAEETQVEALQNRGWYKFEFCTAAICWACVSELALGQGWKRTNETQSENVDTQSSQESVLEDPSGQGG